MAMNHVNSNITLIAHRGMATNYPENTLVAFVAALSSNVDILEIDIHRTSDDYLVIIHDDTIDRTSNGKGKIKASTLAALQTYDYGSWKGDVFSGQTLMTLDEVLALIKGQPQKLLIEIKKPQQYPGIEHDIIDKLIAWKIPKDKVILQSFDQKSIRKIYDMNVRYQLGVLISKKKYWYKLPDFKQIATYANYVNPHFSLVNQKFITTAHNYQLSVMPYTVNNYSEAMALIKLGVDGIISDNPHTILNKNLSTQ